MFVVAKKRFKEKEARGYLQPRRRSERLWWARGSLHFRSAQLGLGSGRGWHCQARRPGPLLQNQTLQSLIAKHSHKTAGVLRVFMAHSPKTHPKWQSQNPHLDPSRLCHNEAICMAVCADLVIANSGLELWGGAVVHVFSFSSAGPLPA